MYRKRYISSSWPGPPSFLHRRTVPKVLTELRIRPRALPPTDALAPDTPASRRARAPPTVSCSTSSAQQVERNNVQSPWHLDLPLRQRRRRVTRARAVVARCRVGTWADERVDISVCIKVLKWVNIPGVPERPSHPVRVSQAGNASSSGYWRQGAGTVDAALLGGETGKLVIDVGIEGAESTNSVYAPSAEHQVKFQLPTQNCVRQARGGEHALPLLSNPTALSLSRADEDSNSEAVSRQSTTRVGQGSSSKTKWRAKRRNSLRAAAARVLRGCPPAWGQSGWLVGAKRISG
ncbi:hypothetical protein C8R43DRAFT_951573 [Mycena crocata]|nr:hypothetical protein C8R43DRAFT_951573 [Mycena crocata]